MPKQRLLQKLVILFAVTAGLHAHASQMTGDALPLRDLNPFIAGFEIPAALPSHIDFNHRNAIDVSYTISNISLDQQQGLESAMADAELHRWQFTITHAFNSRWSIQLELPYQSVSGGSLDSFIENFHHDFGLPNGIRNQWPRNRLLVDYSINNQSLYHLENSTSGVADIPLRAGWQFDAHDTHTTALWFTAKLPTGNANHLTGSGAIDAALTLSASQSINDHWCAYEQASLSLLGKGERLHDQQRESVVSGMAGLSWMFTHSLDVTSQLNWHGPVYGSNIRMLGPATQWSIAPRYHAGHWQAWLAITEDIAVDTAPDVQFQFALSHEF